MGEVQKRATVYEESLEHLTMNNGIVIDCLTKIAGRDIEMAPLIVQATEKYFQKVPVEVKLPVLYLVDSILKNVGKEYTTLFMQKVVPMFCEAYKQANRKMRVQLFNLRETWIELLPEMKLHELDTSVSLIDPAWHVLPLPVPGTSNSDLNSEGLNPSIPSVSTSSIATSTFAQRPSGSVFLTTKEVESVFKNEIARNGMEAFKQYVNNYISMIFHAYHCHDSSCSLPDCPPTKRVVQHTKVCQKVNGSCAVCRLYFSVCWHHVTFCKEDGCWSCFTIKTERKRKQVLQWNQQLKLSEEERKKKALLTASPLSDVDVSLLPEQYSVSLSPVSAAVPDTQQTPPTNVLQDAKQDSSSSQNNNKRSAPASTSEPDCKRSRTTDEEEVKLEDIQKKKEELEKMLEKEKLEKQKLAQERAYVEEELTYEKILSTKLSDRYEATLQEKEAAEKELAERLKKNKEYEEYIKKMAEELRKTKEDLVKSKSRQSLLEKQVESFGGIMETELQCSICLELYVEATTLSCGHIFCAHCLNKCKKKQCPNCKVKFGQRRRAYDIDSLIDSMVNNLSPEFKRRRRTLVYERKGPQAGPSSQA